jgi:hypothetical protein
MSSPDIRQIRIPYRRIRKYPVSKPNAPVLFVRKTRRLSRFNINISRPSNKFLHINIQLAYQQIAAYPNGSEAWISRVSVCQQMMESKRRELRLQQIRI